jgi:hypothetical protein
MKLTEKPVTLRYLTPSEGMWLTQVSETENRVFSEQVILGVNDSPDNWREATEDEKLEWEAEEKARMEAEIAEHEREMPND